MTDRDFSVFPVQLVGEPKATYAKVRALEGTLGIGKRVEVQRPGEKTWRQGRVIDSQSAGTIWIVVEPPS